MTTSVSAAAPLVGVSLRVSRILLVCPFQLLREAFSKLLTGTAFPVAIEVASVEEALPAVERDAAIELVMIFSCERSGEELAFIRRAHEMRQGIRVVVLTAQFCAQHMTDCLDAGADGFLVPDVSTAALVHSLGLVIAGEKVFPTRLADGLMNGEVVVSAPQSPAFDPFTDQEREILSCLVAGDPNKGIARRFDMSEATVKMHLRQLYQKLGVTNRTQAATWAVNNGLSPAA